jgi:hypothetical protein
MSNPLVTQSPNLLIKEVSDVYLRRNFQNLSDYFQANNQLLGFQFFEYNFTKAQANVLIGHSLPSIPLDIITTQITGPGQVTFNYGLFDKSNLNLSSSDAARVRFFAGTYYNFQSSVQTNSTDLWTLGSLVNTSSTSSILLQGTKAPTASVGSVGNFYLDTTNNRLYFKFTTTLWKYISAANPQFFASSIINTGSSDLSSATYANFSNSPAFTFTPTVSGIYKVYTSATIENDSRNNFPASVRIFNTFGAATLLYESKATVYSGAGTGVIATVSNQYIQSIYSLLAGVQYIFDIQGKTTTSGLALDGGEGNAFYMFAELIG